MRSGEPFYLEHKEKLLFLAAALLLAAKVGLPGKPLPAAPGDAQSVPGPIRSAEVAEVRAFIESDLEYYWNEQGKHWIFVEEPTIEVREPVIDDRTFAASFTIEVREPVKLDLPAPYVPEPPWPLPAPGPLLRHTAEQPRLGEPLDTPEIPGVGDDAGGGGE